MIRSQPFRGEVCGDDLCWRCGKRPIARVVVLSDESMGPDGSTYLCVVCAMLRGVTAEPEVVAEALFGH